MASDAIRKLLVKSGMKMLIINGPEGYAATIDSSLPEGAEVYTEPEGTFDFVHLFVKDSTELEKFRETAMQVVSHDGLFWISYPKKTSKIKSDLHRDVLWNVMHEFGMDGVSLISIDNTWSAMRMRPTKK